MSPPGPALRPCALPAETAAGPATPPAPLGDGCARRAALGGGWWRSAAALEGRRGAADGPTALLAAAVAGAVPAMALCGRPAAALGPAALDGRGAAAGAVPAMALCGRPAAALGPAALDGRGAAAGAALAVAAAVVGPARLLLRLALLGGRPPPARPGATRAALAAELADEVVAAEEADALAVAAGWDDGAEAGPPL